MHWNDSKFILRLNVAEHTDYIEKYFKLKLHLIKFPTKNTMDAYLYLLLEWSKGSLKIYVFEIL